MTDNALFRARINADAARAAAVRLQADYIATMARGIHGEAVDSLRKAAKYAADIAAEAAETLAESIDEHQPQAPAPFKHGEGESARFTDELEDKDGAQAESENNRR